jgi:hypothetical protein
MTSDAMRAVQHRAREFAHSKTGQTIGQEALKSFLHFALPHLWVWVNNHFHEIWSWFHRAF